MAGLRLIGFLLAASTALLEAQDCSSGPRFLNANTLAALSSSGIVAFGREDNLPYFTSTLTRFAPYRASLPQVDGNQLLEGCFAANPPLVAPPTSYQSGAGSQRAAVIHSADNSNVGFAMLFYSQQNAVKVWKLNPDLTVGGPQAYSFGNSLNSVLAGDFNADGSPDLAVVGQVDQSNSALWILVNNGDLTFKAPVPYAIDRKSVV